MVGAIGFEPTTPSPPAKCATRLRHAPTFILIIYVSRAISAITDKAKAALFLDLIRVVYAEEIILFQNFRKVIFEYLLIP